MQTLDREARYVIIRGMVEDVIAALDHADTELARAQGLALLDIAVSLVEAIHRIADAQELMLRDYAS